MTAIAAMRDAPSAATTRLAALAHLTSEDRARIAFAESQRSTIASHRDLVANGASIGSARLILKGWAYTGEILSDGSRQIASFVMPGEIVRMGERGRPVAIATATSVTEVVMCPLPAADPADTSSGLAQACGVSAALEEIYLRRQITRLGRMSAHERMTDWLLETHDRLALSGLATQEGFLMPLTQEMLGDALGLTSVHVNRTVRALREDGLVTVAGRRVTFRDAERMKRMVGYRSAKVVR
jgi:CRP-like cAMP-binding protein